MYWKPEYKPLNKNFQCFIDWFSEIFDNVMYDRLDKMKDYGFLLSGGTDSRLIADYLNNEKAFHVNETMNREARLSKKVAKMTKNKFHFLKRNREYLPEILEEVSPLMNFNSTFQQGWSIGFKEVLNDCDVIIHGTRADVMLQGYVIPKRYIPFSKIPIKAKVNSLVDYITYIENYNPKYINFDFELKKSVSMNSKNIKINKVKYKSEEDVLRYGKIYPFTNLQNFFNIEHLYQINKVYSPYKDNRILDFSQYFPTKYQLRRNLIKKILYKKNKNLSKLIHPSSLQPSYRDELIHYFFRYLHLKLDKLKNHMKGEGPWPNYKKIIKDTGYAEENIKENKEILEAFDYLNYKNAISMIQNEQYHSVQQIHSLLSFLKIYDKITC